MSLAIACPADAQSFALNGSTSIRRNEATATQMLSDKILVAGGNDGTMARDTAELYDPTVSVAGSPFAIKYRLINSLLRRRHHRRSQTHLRLHYLKIYIRVAQGLCH
jgi:hypothetical protein